MDYYRLLIAGLAILSFSGTAAFAASEKTLGRAECQAKSAEQSALEAKGIRAILKRDPETVIAEKGRAAADDVRRYIALRETIMFRCPVGFQNAVAAPLSKRVGKIPPLPVRGPRRIVRRQKTGAPVVPLPIKRGKFPPWQDDRS